MHIVIFTGGEAPEPSVTENYFLSQNFKSAGDSEGKKSVRKPDAVIAADSGLETLCRYAEYFKNKIDFTPDFILGDMDSIQDKSLLQKYTSAEKVIFPEYKDYTDTELALKKAYSLFPDGIKSRADRITLAGGDGGRIDHLLGVLETFSAEEKADFWLTKNQLAVFVESENSLEVKKLKQNEPLSIYKINEKKNAFFKTKGLEWNEDVFRNSRMPSLSNRISREYLEKNLCVELMPWFTDCIVFVPYTAAVSVIKPTKSPQPEN